jgi:CubicO group peptidase (beta-lactamase class C family)
LKDPNPVPQRWNRTETWLGLFVLAVLGLIMAIAGLWMYMSATAAPLHPDPRDVPSATHSAPPPEWAQAVERGRQIIRAGLTGQNLPGVSVAVGVDGDIVWAEGLGWSDLENRVRVTPETRFRIGTASTALTSAAVGLLLEKGRLTLDDPIQTSVPGFPEKPWPVTLRQVMGHVAGIRNDAGDEEPVTEHCELTVDALRRFADRPLLFEPGTRYRFSSYGWILVSAAIEDAAGEPFFTFMRKRIFEPLHMDRTGADAAPHADRSIDYFPRFAADPRYGPQEPTELDYSCFAGSSAFLSTPSDLVRFGMAIDSGTLLQPATVHLLQTEQRLSSGEDTGYGLGWDVETLTLGDAPTRVVGHDGELRGGMVASLMMFREHGIVVAVTSNTSFADTFSLASTVGQAFAGQKRDPARR